MSVSIHPATLENSAAIADLLRIVWPSEKAAPAQVASVLENPQHVVRVAHSDNQIVGLVSGFPTKTQAGEPRWEVDLLAVHPVSRRQGIAKELIQRCTNDGREAGTILARALVETTNTASQHAFAAAGYAMQLETYTGYVSHTGLLAHSPARPHSLHLIPVRTLVYTGAWIEGTLTDIGLQWARCLQAERGWERLGTLVTSDLHSAGFEPVGTFAWWIREYSPG